MTPLSPICKPHGPKKPTRPLYAYANNHRSGRPEGAKGDSPGQSEAPPWDWCARNNPSPERAEPAARKPMCYVSPFQGFGELGRRRAQVAGVPRVALRSTLGYLIMPRWGERSRGKNSGTVPGVFQHSVPPFRPLYVPPNRTGCGHAAGQLFQRYTRLFGISGCRTGLGKFFFMPILVGFAGPFHSPRSYTTADVSRVNDHSSCGWA